MKRNGTICVSFVLILLMLLGIFRPLPVRALSSSLISYWPADGNADDIIAGNNGALMNGAGFGPGETNQAFNLSGASQYVQTIRPIPFSSNDFTIDLWANFNSAPTSMIFISDDNGAFCYDKWWFGVGGGAGPGGKLNFHINPAGCAGQGYFAQYPLMPNLHQWYNFAVTRNAGNITIYVDGAKVSSEITSTTSNPTVPVTIGSAEGGNFFNGLIDDVQIYNRALTTSEVSFTFSHKMVAFNPTAWTNKTVIAIDNTLNSHDLKDYQVSMNVTFRSGMQPDFRDLRFAQASASGDYESELSYWIEKKTDNAWALVWVNVDSIPKGSITTIFMYFGNPSAYSASNGHATFIAFDDFEYTDGPENHGWIQDGDKPAYTDTTNALSGSRSLFTKGSDCPAAVCNQRGIHKDVSFNNTVIEGSFYHNATDNMNVYIGVRIGSGTDPSSGGNWFSMFANTPAGQSGKTPAAVDHYLVRNYVCCGVSTGVLFNHNHWNSFKIVKNESVTGYFLGNLVPIRIAPSENGNLPITMIALAGGNSTDGVGGQPWWFDELRVRSYTNPEPTVLAGIPRTVVFNVSPGQNIPIDVAQSLPELRVSITLNVSVPLRLEVTKLPSINVDPPSGTSPLGIFFGITTNQTVRLDARMRVSYTTAQAQNLDENSLAPYAYSPGGHQWVPLDNVSHNITARWVEGTVHHLSLFGMFGQNIQRAISGPNCWYCASWIMAAIAGLIAAVGLGSGMGLYLRKTRRHA